MNDVRERLLLHWVNSLPITSCLLVRELPDLRFGDILSEIVRWVKTQDRLVRTFDSPVSATLDDVRKRVRKVVNFVARECCTRDEDAMYVVNQTNCVECVMKGDRVAISSVLVILKRLVACKQQQQSDLNRTQELAIKQSIVRACTAAIDKQMSKSPSALSLRTSSDTCRKKSSPCRSPRHSAVAVVSRDRLQRVHTQKTDEASPKKEKENIQTQPKKKLVRQRDETSSKIQKHDFVAQSAAVNKAKFNANSLAVGAQTAALSTVNHVTYDETGLHVFGMIDPRVKGLKDCPKAGVGDRKPLRRSLNARCAAIIRTAAAWITTLGISLSPNPPQLQESYALFSDGILLSQVAAAVIRRHGSLDAQRCLQEGPVGVWMLPNTTLYPQNDAQKRKNFESALRVLHAYSPKSNQEGEDNWSVEQLTCQPTNIQGEMKVSEKIWTLLDLIRKSAKQWSHKDGVNTQRHPASESIRGPAAIQPVPATRIMEQQSAGVLAGVQRKRPFISGQQVLAVDEWIQKLGWNLDEVRSPSWNSFVALLLVTDELFASDSKNVVGYCRTSCVTEFSSGTHFARFQTWEKRTTRSD